MKKKKVIKNPWFKEKINEDIVPIIEDNDKTLYDLCSEDEKYYIKVNKI